MLISTWQSLNHCFYFRVSCNLALVTHPIHKKCFLNKLNTKTICKICLAFTCDSVTEEIGIKFYSLFIGVHQESGDQNVRNRVNVLTELVVTTSLVAVSAKLALLEKRYVYTSTYINMCFTIPHISLLSPEDFLLNVEWYLPNC